MASRLASLTSSSVHRVSRTLSTLSHSSAPRPASAPIVMARGLLSYRSVTMHQLTQSKSLFALPFQPRFMSVSSLVFVVSGLVLSFFFVFFLYFFFIFFFSAVLVFSCNEFAEQHRVEKDTFGDINVESEKYWGAQTQR